MKSPREFFVKVGDGAASVLRRVSGGALGWRQTRRGSFLVLVIGTLALLAVIAIVYATIGRQDARTQVAVAKRERLDDVPRQMADWINGIVSDNVLSVTFDGREPLSGAIALTRDASDYPFTDWRVRSNTTDPRLAFFPAGGVNPRMFSQPPNAWNGLQVPPSAPWLASTRPAYIDFQGNGATDFERPYLDKKDWPHITNIAPDGRFVNLVNLRNNFAAQPGTQAGRMSSQLRLWTPGGNGTPTTTLDYGASFDPNIPAHADSRQVRAFRPIRDPQLNLPPSNPGFIGNMWADTDGDGMADARWFEMVDARDLNAIRTLIEADGKYRYFFAARIVDLSSMINVNTATDFRAAPTAVAPAGVNAGDIDLRRVLTSSDFYDLYAVNGNPGALDGIELIDPEDVGRPNQASYYLDATHANAFRAGRFGYDALRMAQAKGAIPPRAAADGTLYAGAAGLQQFATESGLQPSSWDFGSGNGALERARYYERVALQDAGVRYDYDNNNYKVSGVFGLDDTAELLERRVYNNPSLVSNLEVTVGGRDNTVVSPPPGTLRYSPLRDNRELAYERVRDADENGVIDDANYLLFETDVRQLLTTVSGARSFRTARGVDPDRLSVGELRVDPAFLLQGGTLGVNTIFKGYALALAPFSSEQGVWNTAGGEPRTRTLFYGYQGPELATYVSGFMAANFYASAQSGRRPQPFTLLLQEGFDQTIDQERNAPADQQLFGPWHDGRRLDMNLVDASGNRSPVNRLANLSDPVVVPAVNLYGVTPQAFITEVSTFTAYTDAPDSQGGDNENDGEEITINGDLTNANTDAIYRVVAFKLTNPFNRPVQLSESAFTDSQYYNAADGQFPPVDHTPDFHYIQWGDKYFQLAALEEVTYVTNEEATAARSAGLPAVGDTAQFGMYIQPAGSPDIITLNPIVIPAGKTVVCYAVSQVPRKILNDRIVPLDPQLQSQPAAKMRGTIINAIERQIGLGSTDIHGVYWVPEFRPESLGTGRIDLPGQNELRTLVPSGDPAVYLWRTVRTGTEAIADQTISTPGSFWDGTSPRQRPQEVPPRNFTENDQLIDRLRVPTGAGLDRRLSSGNQDVTGTDAQFDDTGYSITLWASVRRKSDPRPGGQEPPEGAIPGYCIEPKGSFGWNDGSRDTVGLGSLSSSDFTSYDGGARTLLSWGNAMRISAIEPDVASAPGRISGTPIGNPQRASGTPYESIYPHIYINGEGYEAPLNPNDASSPRVSTLRLADMLLPIGVGPMYSPITPLNGNIRDPELDRRTTLGEALAMALGYQEGTPLNPLDPLRLFVPEPVGGSSRIAFDRGGLRLDAFAPFEDDDSDGVYTAPFEGGSDVRRWLAIPLGMAVLDNFTASPGGVESLTRAVPGQININTATLPVARALPMLSPPPNNDVTGQPWWWWAGGQLDERADIAAAVLGYRDRVDFDVRPQSAIGGIITFQFSDAVVGGGVVDPSDAATWSGRYASTLIPGLNEQPGFRTVGELLLVKIRNGFNFDVPINIDYLGYDNRNLDRVGVTSAVNPAQGGNPATVYDELADDYTEQFAVFNGVANSVTTRSDYFAVYFVVHGYQESDVNNLGPNDPMVPSIARRFMMVIDRSNVTERGQRGQVVLFKEVPYSY